MTTSQQPFRHDVACGGYYACTYGIPEFPERGEVAACEDCGRTWVALSCTTWRRETTTERRRRLGLRWWQRTPPWNAPGGGDSRAETETGQSGSEPRESGRSTDAD